MTILTISGVIMMRPATPMGELTLDEIQMEHKDEAGSLPTDMSCNYSGTQQSPTEETESH